MSDCKHERVDRSVSEPPVWVCQPCGATFVPIEAIEQVEQTSDAVIDMATGMFSAIIWDLHQRAQEAGQVGTYDPADIVTQEEVMARVCEEKGHRRDEATGACSRCGDSPFLGGP